MSTNIFIFNGPNLNLLGTREPEIYGTTTLAEIDAACVAKAREHGLSIDFRQSNHEGVLVDWMHQAHKAKARAIILELAHAHDDVLEVVGCPVVNLGASSVDLSLRAWCADASTAKGVEFDLLEQIKTRFDEAGIEIPYAYQNVIVSGAISEEKGASEGEKDEV